MRSIIDSNGYEVTEADVYEPKTGICSECGEACEVGIEDNSFSHEFGVEHVYDEVSSCCGATVLEGGVTEVRSAIHYAKRDHKDGSVKAGEWYVVRVFRHWVKNGPSWITTTKHVLYHGCEMTYSFRFQKDWYLKPEIKDDSYSHSKNWARWSMNGKPWPV